MVMINGIIYTLVKQLYHQNIEQKDYIQIVALLYIWLCARGWKHEKIKLIILQAITKAQQLKPPPNVQGHNNNHNQYFLNLQCHQSDFPQAKHQIIFKGICSPLEDITNRKGRKLSIKKLL